MTRSSTVMEQFERKVDCWVRDAVAHGHTSLDQILHVLPGVYPTIARDALRRMAPRLHTAADESVIQENLWSKLTSPISHAITLPVPHPLDYDWRFSDAAVAYLLNTSDTLAPVGATIALLGTPSIMRTVIEEPRQCTFVLLEANTAMTTCLAQAAPAAHIIQCDVGQDPLPNIAASVVIADPPWYEENMQSFLWAASQLCHVNGSILMSVPPIGTRPGMAQEWERMLRWAERLGLSLIRLEPNVLEYLTPPFERNALRAEGLDAALPSWRRGNLAIFTRRAERHTTQLSLPALDESWDEVEIAGVRVRLRSRDVVGFADPSLVPLVPGHVLPSVSRRDLRRQRVDVWTSANRVFVCQATSLLGTIIRTIALHQSPVDEITARIERSLTATEQSLVMRASRQVTRLLAYEQRDLLEFWEETAHDKPVHLTAH